MKKKLMKARLAVYELVCDDLDSIEWSGERQGQGCGPMGSGGGPMFPACPVCGQLEKKNGHFIAEAVSHLPDCALVPALAALREAEKKREKTARLAVMYGAGDINVGKIVGEYPPKDLRGENK